MQNLSDHDIDQMFRQAAEQNQPEFDPADWKIVAHQLDRSKWWLRLGKWFGTTATVAVLVTAGWFTVNYFASESQEAAPLSGSIAGQVKSETIDNSGKLQASDSSSTDRINRSITLPASNGGGEKETTGESLKSDRTAESNDTGVSPTESKKEQKESVVQGSYENAADKKVENGRGRSRGNGNSNAQNQKQKYSDAIVNEDEVSTTATRSSKSQRLEGTNISEVEPATATGADVVAPEGNVEGMERSVPLERHTRSEGESAKTGNSRKAISETSDDTKVKDDSIAVKKELASDKKVDGNEKQNDSTKEQSSFARIGLRLKASPDYSSENFEASGKTGFNYGIEVEYFATEHVSISAGLIRSRKYYAMHDAKYFNFVDLDIDGDCQMWDIPLNVNYYFSPSKNYSMFLSGGFSSYLMSEENYTFQVTTPGYSGDETQTYARQVRGENQEWFKTLNISLGLQRRITRNFALQVEPFVKIPLAEVGSANISLSSFGTYLSLRYNFLFDQK